MGRLDDAAKHKVVELRKAGLSFRKIKAVLELENIKVSAQAIYLFLREFQGRPPGRVRPSEAGSSSSPVRMQPRGSVQDGWSGVHLQNLLRDSSHHAGFSAADFPKQTSSNPEAAAGSSGPAESSGEQQRGDKEENDIQIVSVTSLASRPEPGPAAVRRRVTASPASGSMLAARRRLLDKALSHRMKSFQQVASLLRRDQSGVPGSDPRSALPETYDLTSDKVEAHPGGGSAPRRFLAQRPGLLRSLHPPPRVGIRLPNRPLAALGSSGPGSAVIRLQAPGRGEGNPGPQQAVQDAAARGLPDQIQALGSEVRGLSLAVKMLVEQQHRLEREQVQQTQVQKQILSTLQTLASRAGPCSGVQQQQQTKTPSPSAAPSFGQDAFSFSQTSYAQNQTFSPLEALDPSEAFKLPGLSPAGINGFPACSSAESAPLSHSSPQQQPYYAQQGLVAYSQPYSTFSPQTFRAPHSSCSGSFQDCSGSTAPGPTQDQQVSSIKVEGP